MKSLWQVGITGCLVLALLASPFFSGDARRRGGFIDLLFSMEREQRRGLQLNAEIEAGHELQELHQRLANQLIQHEITLLAAAAHYRSVLLRMPSYMQALRWENHGKTEDESLCRLAIRSVRYALEGQPEQETVLARLEAELEALLPGFSVTPYSES